MDHIERKIIKTIDLRKDEIIEFGRERSDYQT